MGSSLVVDYSRNIEEACMQRTGELIISKIIDQELQRIQESLFCDLFVADGDDERFLSYISTILTKEYEKPLLEELDQYITKVPILLSDPGLSPEIKEKVQENLLEKKSILFPLEAETDLSIARVHYYYNLQTIKESLIYLIQHPHFLSHLFKVQKHSSRVWIYLYKRFFRKEYTVCYESLDFIYDMIDQIDIEVAAFKNAMKK